MISYAIIVKIIDESSRINAGRIVIRQLEIELSRNIIERKPVKVITGIRRSGKSFLLKRLYLKLIQEHIPQEK
ncbi:MAG: hypothetical protein JXB88_25000 [Spirochaetales bacterium]|nr:hypothetical protein [Spirochaetales bacterium]